MVNAVDIKNILNPITSDKFAPKLYMQGMGGSSIGIKIPQYTIDALKQKYKNAQLRIIYTKK